MEGLKHDFTIRSSVSTASVRGTVLDDEDGEEYHNEHGTFVVKTPLNQEVTVSDKESTQVAPPEEGGSITPPVEVLTAGTEVVPQTTVLPDIPTGTGGEIEIPDIPDELPPEPTTTTVTITWN